MTRPIPQISHNEIQLPQEALLILEVFDQISDHTAELGKRLIQELVS